MNGGGNLSQLLGAMQNQQGPSPSTTKNSMPTFNGNNNSYGANAMQSFMARAPQSLGLIDPSLTMPSNWNPGGGGGAGAPPPGGTPPPGTPPPGTPPPGTPPPGIPGNPLGRGPGGPGIPGNLPGAPPPTNALPGAPGAHQKDAMIRTTPTGAGSMTPDVMQTIANAGPPPPGATGWSAGPYGPNGQWIAVPQWDQKTQGYLTSAMHPTSGKPSWLTPDVQNQEFTNPNFLALIQQLSGKQSGNGAGNFGY